MTEDLENMRGNLNCPLAEERCNGCGIPANLQEYTGGNHEKCDTYRVFDRLGLMG